MGKRGAYQHAARTIRVEVSEYLRRSVSGTRELSPVDPDGWARKMKLIRADVDDVAHMLDLAAWLEAESNRLTEEPPHV